MNALYAAALAALSLVTPLHAGAIADAFTGADAYFPPYRSPVLTAVERALKMPLLPANIPHGRPAQAELTADLRSRTLTLGLNGLPATGGRTISRALLLLPADRSQPGTLTFEIDGGSRAGIYQCEALGRGATSREEHTGFFKGLIDGATIYYAPMTEKNGATIPGVYDLRNISPEKYEIAFLGQPPDPAKEARLLAAVTGDGKPKPHFSSVWRHWYPPEYSVMPVDMIWAEDSQYGTQGAGVPLFERRPSTGTPEEGARLETQLEHDPAYYRGPYGRSGFAVHTDRWESAERQSAPEYAGRPELTDFRWRDTSGCVKLRPACLELFNEFVSEQERLGRRPQLEVRQTEPVSGC